MDDKTGRCIRYGFRTGAWLEYETDSNNVVSVRIDRTRKLITVFGSWIRTDARVDSAGEMKTLATIQKDNTKSEEEGCWHINAASWELPTVESASTCLTIFDPKRYDLSKKRYKFNKKLALAYRIWYPAADDIHDGQTGN